MCVVCYGTDGSWDSHLLSEIVTSLKYDNSDILGSCSCDFKVAFLFCISLIHHCSSFSLSSQGQNRTYFSVLEDLNGCKFPWDTGDGSLNLHRVYALTGISL